jgi:hypothetical protein
MKSWNWKTAFIPILAAVFLTYEEIRDDWDPNPQTKFEKELVLLAWSAALSILLGTTTTHQTAAIAEKKVEELK